MNELALIFKDDVAFADSRDIASYFGKNSAHVTRDIKKMLEAIDPDKSKNGFAYRIVTYKNPEANGKTATYYELDFDTTMTLITGYDVKMRNKIIKQWHRLLKERTKARDYAKGIRHDFTNTLQARGYTKRHEFINTTRAMKKPLGITAKKADMTEAEIKKITAAEYLAEAMLADEMGYHEVNPVCVEASTEIERILGKRKITA